MSHIRSSGSGRSGGTIRFATRFAIVARYFANGITFGWLMTVAGAAACPAGELAMRIIDPAGGGVTDVVVTAAPVDEHVAAPPAAPATAVMDQRDLAFVPRILVVAVGTSVEFPNNDSVSHQVYSFSPAKRFQLPLYKGGRHPPVTFEHEGLVVLGCNIHDEMVGYIYVTDAPFFGKTDASGTLHLQNLPAGDYRVTVWNPLIADPAPSLTRNVHVDTHEITADRVQLSRRLRVRPEPRPRRGDWEY
jgi:plastocyanin